MSKVCYITYTEPANHFSGNEVKFFVREFDLESKIGKSHVFVKNIPFIIPTFEMPNGDAERLLEECQNEFPQIEFKKKHYSMNKSVIWAYINDKKLISGIGKNKAERIKLPAKFLDKKSSYSQQLRFYYPPYTLVDIADNELKLPEKQEKTIVDLDTIILDKKCAMDIETMDYDNPQKERISNVVLNFNKNKYIITTFVPKFHEWKGYQIISVRNNSKEKINPKESTDKIKQIASDIIQKEDPLIIYGYNLPFDQSKLRDLGEKKVYTPGVSETGPVYKSVQGMKNMITKGRMTIDSYGYLFFYSNFYENNKLETHSRMAGINFTKGLPYEILAFKTKNGENGSNEDMEKCLDYVVEDGDTTMEIGEKNIKKIILKSRFVKREPSTICTSSGKNIMKEYWNKQFFLKMNTLRDRYEKYHKEDTFILEDYQNELLDLDNDKRKDGLFENVSMVYPLLFIKSLWDTMLSNTVENLRFNTPEEKFDSYQTLNEYITNAIKEYLNYKAKIKETPERKDIFNYVMKNEYGANIDIIDSKLDIFSHDFKEILNGADLINYSKKFLYVKNPEKIVERNLGYIFGKGNCLCAKNKIVTLIEDSNNKFPKLIYQSFGLSRGEKTQFDIKLMRDFLLKRLRLESNEKALECLDNKMNQLDSGEIPKENLLFGGIYEKELEEDLAKELMQKYSCIYEDKQEILNKNGKGTENFTKKWYFRKGPGYGYVKDEEYPLSTTEFLMTGEKPDYSFYKKNFLRAFEDLLYVGMNKSEINNSILG